MARLATIRRQGSTSAAVIDDQQCVELPFADVGTLLAAPGWRGIADRADGPEHELASVELAPVVPNPAKIFCVGLNYLDHVNEGGHKPPQFPTLFAKFARTLVGPTDPIHLPSVSDRVDYEAELAVVIGRPARGVTRAAAAAAIAGYTVMNDVSVRDFQARTSQWLQGKNFEATTPLGPWLVTDDEAGPVADMQISCEVDGVELQSDSCGRLLFDPLDLIAYISQFITLEPGDVIATGTPGGVGKAQTPPVFLKAGTIVRTAVRGVGECVNVCVQD